MITISRSLFQGFFLKRKRWYVYYLPFNILLFGLSGCFLDWSWWQHGLDSNSNLQQAAYYNLQLGLSYLQIGDKLRAKSKLFEAERQAPNDPLVHSAIAYFLELAGELENAERYHLKALKLGRTNGTTHNNYGCFLCQCKRYKKAEMHFLKAVQDKHYINTANAYENAGLCMMRANESTYAISYLKKATQHNPQSEKSWLALAQLYQTKQPHLAYKYLKYYQQLAVKCTPGSLLLGMQLAQTLNDEKAMHHYISTLHAQYPQSFEYQKMIGTDPDLKHDVV